jgi:hypothetical protein
MTDQEVVQLLGVFVPDKWYDEFKYKALSLIATFRAEAFAEGREAGIDQCKRAVNNTLYPHDVTDTIVNILDQLKTKPLTNEGDSNG